MLNYQLEILGEEFVSSIGHSDEFYVNLLFDRSIYRPICTHMGYFTHLKYILEEFYLVIREVRALLVPITPM